MSLLLGLQRNLQDIYAIDGLPDVTDFLVRGEPDSSASPLSEAVLVQQRGHVASVGVYYDPKVIARLQSQSPLDDLSDERLPDLLVALEGLSHFIYLLFNARRDCSISMLELEMQAEVDKFVATWFLAESQGYFNSSAGLKQRLFHEAQPAAGLSRGLRERYQVASDYGLEFCKHLQLFGPSHQASLRRLRRFYRLGRDAKMSWIHDLKLSN